jgi:xanthine/uracil permease
MQNTYKYSNKAFAYSVALLFILTIVQLFKFYRHTIPYYDIFGITILLIGIIIASIGITYSLKGIKDKNTAKKIIAIIVNLGFGSLSILAIISILIDKYYCI